MRMPRKMNSYHGVELLKRTSNCFNRISANKCRIRVGVITDSTITTRRSRQLAILYLNHKHSINIHFISKINLPVIDQSNKFR